MQEKFCLDKQTQKLIKLYKDILKKFLIIDYSLNLETKKLNQCLKIQ